MGKTIGVISLKGGVGKTSSVVSLGDALASFGKSVLLVDANFSAPNLGIHLNLMNPEDTLHHVLDKTKNISDVIYSFGERFHVIPSNMFHKNEINPLALRNKLKTLKDRYDIILIDSAPAINDESLATMLASDEVLVVTTPDYATLATTLKTIQMIKQRGIPISGLILNKVHGKDFELNIAEIEKTAGVPVMAVIPDDIGFLEAQAKFMPYTLFKPKSRVSEEFRKLAATLSGEIYKPFNMRRLLGFDMKREEVNRQLYYSRVFKD